jgi:hypothetical protein
MCQILSGYSRLPHRDFWSADLVCTTFTSMASRILCDDDEPYNLLNLNLHFCVDVASSPVPLLLRASRTSVHLKLSANARQPSGLVHHRHKAATTRRKAKALYQRAAKSGQGVSFEREKSLRIFAGSRSCLQNAPASSIVLAAYS